MHILTKYSAYSPEPIVIENIEAIYVFCNKIIKGNRV